MATNPIGAGKAVVSASVPQELADEILRRATRLKWSKSKYAGELLERWYAEGCRPLSVAELPASEAYYFGGENEAAAVAEPRAVPPPVPKPPATG